MAQQFTITATFDANGAIRSIKRTTREINKLEKGFFRAQRSLGAVGTILGTVFAGLSFKGLAESVNTIQDVENRLRALSEEGTDTAAVQDRLNQIARETRSSFKGTADLYTRLLLSSKELGKSQEDLFKFTERVNKAIILSGASAKESNAALIQLSQGLASGTLRGDELRSVLEQLPAVADIIAKGLGATRGELRQLGEDGKISAEAIFDAFETLGESEIDDKFGKTITTVGQSFTVLTNAFLQFITELERNTGALTKLANAITFTAEQVDLLTDSFDRYTGRIREAEQESTKFGQLGLAINLVKGELEELEKRPIINESVSKRIEQLKVQLAQLKEEAKNTTKAAGEEPVDSKALAKANQEAAQLAIIRRKVLSDAKAPQEKFRLQVQAIREEREKDNITAEEANILLNRYGQTLERLKRGATSSADRRLEQLQRENEIRRVAITFGEVEAELLRRKFVLQREGKELTAEQEAALRKELEVRKDLLDLEERRDAATAASAERLQKEREATALLEQQANTFAGLTDSFDRFAAEANNTRQVVNDIADSFANNLSNTIATFVTTGKASFKEFANALLGDIARIIARLLVVQALSSLGGGSGLGGLLGAGASAGARASGGPVNKNKSYLVGENGPEMFTPGENGRVTSNKDLQAAQAAPAPAPVTNLQVVNVTDPAMVPEAITDGSSDDAIINVLGRNADQIRNILQG